jgi:hypothetical protein
MRQGVAALEKIPVVGNGEMDIFFGGAEAVDEKRGDIGQPTGLGPESLRIIRKLLGNVGNFGSDEKDPGSRGGRAFLTLFFCHGAKMKWPGLFCGPTALMFSF